MAYLPSKTWKPGDPYNPEDFNLFVKGNLEALVQRPEDHGTVNGGGSDITWTSTTFIQHPDPDISHTELVLTAAPGDSVAFFNLSTNVRVGTTANRLVAFDIYWVEKEVYLSTMTNTPASNGLGYIRTVTIAEEVATPMVWVQSDIPEGDNTFRLMVRVNGDTAAEERGQSPFLFNAFLV